VSRLAASPRLLVGVALAGAALLAAALVLASLIGSRRNAAEPPAPVTPAGTRDALLRGIPQAGAVLGRPDAPVTLVEYADLQCPWCAAWARDAFPAIVERYVRTGRVRIVFRGLAFLGPDSDKALRAALAAGEQDRLWDVVHGLYSSQGAENSGWVSDVLLRGLAAGAGLDPERMLAGTTSPRVEREIADSVAAAERAGVPGTPFFEAGPTGGRLEPLQVSSLDAAAFTAELDRLLAS
jgi:protein-disulfide isomerase